MNKNKNKSLAENISDYNLAVTASTDAAKEVSLEVVEVDSI